MFFFFFYIFRSHAQHDSVLQTIMYIGLLHTNTHIHTHARARCERTNVYIYIYTSPIFISWSGAKSNDPSIPYPSIATLFTTVSRGVACFPKARCVIIYIYPHVYIIFLYLGGCATDGTAIKFESPNRPARRPPEHRCGSGLLFVVVNPLLYIIIIIITI